MTFAPVNPSFVPPQAWAPPASSAPAEPPEIPDEDAVTRYYQRVAGRYGEYNADTRAFQGFCDLAHFINEADARGDADAGGRLRYVWRRMDEDWNAFVQAERAAGARPYDPGPSVDPSAIPPLAASAAVHGGVR